MSANKVTKAMRAIAFAAVLLAGTPSGQAATLSPALAPVFPDLLTSTATLTYTYVAVCEKSNGQTGACGNPYNTSRWDLSYGKLTITKDGTQTLKPTSSTTVTVSDTSGLNYDLTVIFGFNSTGTALSGILLTDPWTGDATYTSNLLAKGTTSQPGYTSGTIVSGKPTSAVPYGGSGVFGYGGTDLSGKFEFLFNNVGGDMAANGSLGGIIASTSNLSHPLLPSGGAATWDSKTVNLWKNNFTATAAVETFVPVPAAVWLFGSALAGIACLRRRDA